LTGSFVTEAHVITLRDVLDQNDGGTIPSLSVPKYMMTSSEGLRFPPFFHLLK